jgi:hypothetical protein
MTARTPASDARLAAMKLCLLRTRDYDPIAFYDLWDVVAGRLSPEERARFDAIPWAAATPGVAP